MKKPVLILVLAALAGGGWFYFGGKLAQPAVKETVGDKAVARVEKRDIESPDFIPLRRPFPVSSR